MYKYFSIFQHKHFISPTCNSEYIPSAFYFIEHSNIIMRKRETMKQFLCRSLEYTKRKNITNFFPQGSQKYYHWKLPSTCKRLIFLHNEVYTLDMEMQTKFIQVVAEAPKGKSLYTYLHSTPQSITSNSEGRMRFS